MISSAGARWGGSRWSSWCPTSASSPTSSSAAPGWPEIRWRALTPPGCNNPQLRVVGVSRKAGGGEDPGRRDARAGRPSDPGTVPPGANPGIKEIESLDAAFVIDTFLFLLIGIG